MTSFPRKRFYSFDGTETVDTSYQEPDRYRALWNLPNDQNFTVLGGGYSYVPAGLSSSNCIILNKHFNRILAFDKAQKRIAVESGVTVRRLYEFLSPHRLTLNVLPGYPEITVGGCVASNIHGKNQIREGIFSDIVAEMKLFHPRHGILNLSPTENREIFEITCGGYGLTGYILEITLKLDSFKGSYVKLEKVPVRSNEELLNKIQDASEHADLVYSWQNFTSRQNFGSGFLYFGSYRDDRNDIKNKISYNILDAEGRTKRSLKFFNYVSTCLFNQAYQWKERLGVSRDHLSLFEFSFPVVNKMIYFQLFGKQGFYEYQVIIPLDRFLDFAKDLESLLKRKKVPVTLASCKFFKGKQKFLHFTSDGICLALDMPASPSSRTVMGEIDQLTLAYQGLPNIGKDSRLPVGVVAQTYKEYDAFRKVLRDFDPDRLVQSQLRKRLEL